MVVFLCHFQNYVQLRSVLGGHESSVDVLGFRLQSHKQVSLGFLVYFLCVSCLGFRRFMLISALGFFALIVMTQLGSVILYQGFCVICRITFESVLLSVGTLSMSVKQPRELDPTTNSQFCFFGYCVAWLSSFAFWLLRCLAFIASNL